MKEVALLLGELVENAPVYLENSKHGLIPTKQVLQPNEKFSNRSLIFVSLHRN